MVAGVEYTAQEKAAKKLAVLHAIQTGACFTLDEACRIAELPRYQAWVWMRDDVEFKEAWDDAKQQAYDTMLDTCERALMANVAKGDNTAMIFFMKTQGRLRGFQERLEVTSTVTHTIDVKEAAKRIAFAMNAAIEQGQSIEGEFKEVVTLPNEAVVKAKKLVDSGAIDKATRKAAKPRPQAT